MSKMGSGREEDVKIRYLLWDDWLKEHAKRKRPHTQLQWIWRRYIIMLLEQHYGRCWECIILVGDCWKLLLIFKKKLQYVWKWKQSLVKNSRLVEIYKKGVSHWHVCFLRLQMELWEMRMWLYQGVNMVIEGNNLRIGNCLCRWEEKLCINDLLFMFVFLTF